MIIINAINCNYNICDLLDFFNKKIYYGNKTDV